MNLLVYSGSKCIQGEGVQKAEKSAYVLNGSPLMPNSNSCQNLIILLGKRSKIEINPAYEYKKIMHQLGGYNSLQGFFEVIFTVWGEQ